MLEIMSSLYIRFASQLTFYTTSLLSPTGLIDLRSVLNHESPPASPSSSSQFPLSNIKAEENLITFSDGAARYQKITKLANLTEWGMGCQTFFKLLFKNFN